MTAADTTVVAEHLAKLGFKLHGGDMVIASVAFARKSMVHVTAFGSVITVNGIVVGCERYGNSNGPVSDDVIACIKGLALCGSITAPTPFIRAISRMIGAVEIQDAMRPLMSERAQYRSEHAELTNALTAIERIADMRDTSARIKRAIDDRTALIKGLDDKLADLRARLDGPR